MWLHGKGKKDTWSRTLQQHTLCYAKDKKQLKAFREVQSTDWAKTNADNDPRGNWFSGSISFTEKRSNPNHKNFYTITSPSGKSWTRQWQTDQAHMKELIADNRIFWGQAPAYDKVPRVKIFNEEESEVIPRNIIEPAETTRAAQNHLDQLLGQSQAFDNPKPVSLIKHLIEISRQPDNALIMDFFAGSGTTFEAVCSLNAKDGGKRRCILVQKDENEIFPLCKKRCEKAAALLNHPEWAPFIVEIT
jgi:adenine-specific DNA-methyltransferase